MSQLAELEHKFSLGNVRAFMAIAWVLFIIALSVAMFKVVVVKPKAGRHLPSGLGLTLMVEMARAVKMLCQMFVIMTFSSYLLLLLLLLLLLTVSPLAGSLLLLHALAF
jgi:hypothetical protein